MSVSEDYEGEHEFTGEDDPGEGAGGGDRFDRRLDEITTALSHLAQNQQQFQRQTAEQAEAAQRAATERQIEARGQQLNGNLTRMTAAISQAEAQLAAAFDSDDPALQARRQRELSEAITRKANAEREMSDWRAAKQEYDRRKTEKPADKKPEAGQQDRPDTTNLDRWTDANKAWYGTDVEMTKAAKTIAQQIEEAGVIPKGSSSYFSRISSEMRRRYPDYFSQTPDGGGGGARGGARPGGTSSGRVPAEVVQAWRRMGIDTSDEKVMQRMVQHTGNLRKKGILSETPQYGRILT